MSEAAWNYGLSIWKAPSFFILLFVTVFIWRHWNRMKHWNRGVLYAEFPCSFSRSRRGNMKTRSKSLLLWAFSLAENFSDVIYSQWKYDIVNLSRCEYSLDYFWVLGSFKQFPKNLAFFSVSTNVGNSFTIPFYWSTVQSVSVSGHSNYGYYV